MVPVIKRPKSLRRTFALSILAVHLAVLAATLVISFTLLFFQSQNQALDEGLRNVEYMGSQMDNLVSNLADIRRLLLQDQNVKEYLAVGRSTDVEDVTRCINVSQRLSQIIQSYNRIDSITLFQWSGAIMNVSRSRVSQNNSSVEALPIQDTPQYKKITGASSLTWGGCYLQSEMAPVAYATGKQEKVVAMLMLLPDIWNPEHISVVSINIPLSYFDFLYSRNANNGSNVYLISEKGECLLSVPAGNLQNQADYGQQILAQGTSAGSFTGHSGNTRSKVIYRLDERTGWYLAEEIPYPIFLRNMQLLQTTTGLTFTISIFVAVLISYYVSWKLFGSFGKMTHLMSEIGKGDLYKRLPAMEYQELDTLALKFNSMMEEIQKLIRKNQAYEREKRKLEIETLQAQINPHFLYNSLATIRWMASMARASNVCQALLALNNALQPVFSQTDILWDLSSEEKFVQNFVDIMKFRFGENIHYASHLPQELEKVRILRFLLQPVVENAIIHGLRGKPDSTIEIDVEQADGTLKIHISDNGCGIAPDALEQLNRSLADTSRPDTEKKGHGFGLYSINRRIRLHYGEGYGLGILSAADKGTTVTICIPVVEASEPELPAQGPDALEPGRP